jgi:hypothetical protein
MTKRRQTPDEKLAASGNPLRAPVQGLETAISRLSGWPQAIMYLHLGAWFRRGVTSITPAGCYFIEEKIEMGKLSRIVLIGVVLGLAFAATTTEIQAQSAIVGITSSVLTDGKMEMWSIDRDGLLWNSYKESPDNFTFWTPLRRDGSINNVVSVSIVQLADKRLRLFAVRRDGQVWSKWKLDPQAFSDWSPWVLDKTISGAASVSTAILPDGRVQAWVVNSDGSVWSYWQIWPSSDSLWTPWVRAY